MHGRSEWRKVAPKGRPHRGIDRRLLEQPFLEEEEEDHDPIQQVPGWALLEEECRLAWYLLTKWAHQVAAAAVKGEPLSEWVLNGYREADERHLRARDTLDEVYWAYMKDYRL
jgi:hypothetical protein